MNSINYINSRYKPYRYSINKSVTVIDSTSGKYIIKKQYKDLQTLFNYLKSRGFYNFPNIEYNYHNEENIIEFIEEDYTLKEHKLIELANIVASLHNKTVYFKDTSIDNYKEIKENIEENIDYLSVYYEGLFLNICKKEFQSPSEYLYARNYYRLKQAFVFAKDRINDWYEEVPKNEFRVSIIHNDLSLDHFIYNASKSVLISWDKYRIDSPIIDIVNLYKKEYFDVNFESFFKEYFKRFELLDFEKELLFIILAIPEKIDIESGNEFEKTKLVKKLIEYINKTDQLTRPYYSKEEEK